MRNIVLIAHNLRSCHNVGSLLRTAEGLGVTDVWLTGYTPYPPIENDPRGPYIAQKMGKQINKTALGAEDMIAWHQSDDIFAVLKELREDGYLVNAIEQTGDSIKLPEFTAPQKVALLVGREVEGVEPEVLEACDNALEIPMFGQKESFNVVQAAAMGLYQCRFM